MFDASQSLLPKPFEHENKPQGANTVLQALVIGFEPAMIEEIQSLLQTLGVKTAHSVELSLRQINPATYVTQGKCEEAQMLCETHECDLVVIDAELSPNQLRNFEKAVGRPVLDRGGVIIEIFSQHARTKEAKTQVELARIQYLLPRLAHFWTHFERQRGGIGNKGMGESQLEVDRRLLKRRMQMLHKRLEDIVKERAVQRASRKDLLKVALVGYTNAGKSTLLNALTRSSVLAENKLFATLDASIRLIDPDTHPPVVAIDTVGFISRIPTDLIASFRSTLEELQDADLLLHVVDSSSPYARAQIEVTQKILTDLGLDKKPQILVLNKIDQCETPAALNWTRVVAPGAQRVSALDKDHVDALRQKVLGHFRQHRLELWELLVPYEDPRTGALLHQHGAVETERFMEKGTFFRLRIAPELARKFDLARYRMSGEAG